MTVTKLTSISNFLGLSSDDKPTGQHEGSNFYEKDTRAKYVYHDKEWHETNQPIDIISNAAPVVDVRAVELIKQMFAVLKKIEYHLSIASDVDLNDQDV